MKDNQDTLAAPMHHSEENFKKGLSTPSVLASFSGLSEDALNELATSLKAIYHFADF